MSNGDGEGTLGKWVVAGFALFLAYSWGHSEGRSDERSSRYTAQAAQPYTSIVPQALAASGETPPAIETEQAPEDTLGEAEEPLGSQPSVETPAYDTPAYRTAPPVSGNTAEQDARFAQLYRDWNEADAARGGNDSEALPPPVRLPSTPARVAPAGSITPQREPSGRSYTYTAPVPIYVPPTPSQAAAPRYGCAENGSCYGDLSPATGKPKTVFVPGYVRKDGTYVRGHYKGN